MLTQVAQARTDRTPSPMSQSLLQADSGYSWVSGGGRFRPAPVLLLDNQRRGDQVGVHVFAIFDAEAGDGLLVDLGWLPLPGDRRLPAITVPPGRQVVAGLLSPPPAAGLALGPDHVASSPQTWLLGRVDVAKLGQSLATRLAPRVLRLDPALPIGYPRDLDILANTLPPERHIGYAVQWFGLALTVLATSLFLGFGRKKQ